MVLSTEEAPLVSPSSVWCIESPKNSAQPDGKRQGIMEQRPPLPRMQSAPIKRLFSTGPDMDELRLSFAAKLVLAAVEGRHAASAVDMAFTTLKSNLLARPLYRDFMLCVILGHHVLALWEDGDPPFPLSPTVFAAEILAFLCYTMDVVLNFWTFGIMQYRDKKWHLVFAALTVLQFILFALANLAAACLDTGDGQEPDAAGEERASGCWGQGFPRVTLLCAQALRPMILISQLRTIRRVFSNILRTIFRAGSILALGGVVITFYSVLAVNLFNSDQVSGYGADNDHFDNFGAALLSLFILTTEENFPTVADPSFSQRPLVAYPFFVSFLLVFLVVILPLHLAVVLDAYAHHHAARCERNRRKARNALLAAYYVLDEDGIMGLSEDQVVGVLTTEAGVGVDVVQAQQLWEIVSLEDPDGEQRRSLSAPLRSSAESNAWVPDAAKPCRSPARSPACPGSEMPDGHAGDLAGVAARSETTPVCKAGESTSPSPSPSPREDRAARVRAFAASRAMTPRRVNADGFLQLADLLHQKVVFRDWEDDQASGVTAGRSPVSGHYGAVSRQRNHGRGVETFWSVDNPATPSKREGGVQGGSRSGGDSASASDSNGRSYRDILEQSSASDGHALRPRCVGWTRSFRDGTRKLARRVVKQAWFIGVSQGVAVILTILSVSWTPTSQHRYDACLSSIRLPPDNLAFCSKEDALKWVEGSLLLAFAAEIYLKVMAFGWRPFYRANWVNVFDFVVLHSSLLAFFIGEIPGNRMALILDRHDAVSDLLELPRAIRVLRLLTVFPRLLKLLETMSTVGGVLVRIMVLYSCVSYSFAVFGMAIFGDATSDVLPARYSFRTLPNSALALFFLTITNNWNDLLYPLIASVKMGRWSALYFVIYMLFCSIIMFDVLVGVVIEGFRVSIRGPDEVSRQSTAAAGSVGHQKPPGLRREHCSAASPAIARCLSRGGSLRRYAQVSAEDMFRSSDPKEDLSPEDVRELEGAVKAVEDRLHRVWVKRVQKQGILPTITEAV